MFYGILKSRIVHVHISKPFYLLIMTLICKCFNVSVIITIHSNIDRFLYLEKSLLNLAIYLVDYPIVLNENSFQHAMCFNDNTILMSAFIPKTELKAVENRWIKTLRNIKKKNLSNKVIVTTSAWNYVLNESGNEIYGVTEIIKWALRQNHILIIFDPSGNYKKQILSSNLMLNTDIIFLNGNLDFLDAMRFCDVFIRNTTTDGDSLSLHEVLSIYKPVWATKVVTRPKGVYLYDVLEEVDVRKPSYKQFNSQDVPGTLIKLYNRILNGNLY